MLQWTVMITIACRPITQHKKPGQAGRQQRPAEEAHAYAHKRRRTMLTAEFPRPPIKMFAIFMLFVTPSILPAASEPITSICCCCCCCCCFCMFNATAIPPCCAGIDRISMDCSALLSNPPPPGKVPPPGWGCPPACWRRCWPNTVAIYFDDVAARAEPPPATEVWAANAACIMRAAGSTTDARPPPTPPLSDTGELPSANACTNPAATLPTAGPAPMPGNPGNNAPAPPPSPPLLENGESGEERLEGNICC